MSTVIADADLSLIFGLFLFPERRRPEFPRITAKSTGG